MTHIDIKKRITYAILCDSLALPQNSPIGVHVIVGFDKQTSTVATKSLVYMCFAFGKSFAKHADLWTMNILHGFGGVHTFISSFVTLTKRIHNAADDAARHESNAREPVQIG